MQLSSDIAIIGSGIAGLWAFKRLSQQGYNVTLFEPEGLGGTQTLASQGMIHGGQRYALTGIASQHAFDLKAMPAIWGACLQGGGLIDLSKVEVLSDSQVIWAPASFVSKVTAYVASKSMASTVKELKPKEWPQVFQDSPRNAKSTVYELGEAVVAVKSLVRELIAPFSHKVVHARFETMQVNGSEVHGQFRTLDNNVVTCRAQAFLFAAGCGNEHALKQIPNEAKVFATQRRPLRQVMVKGMKYPLYGHCITADPRPRVTITSHLDPENPSTFIWYLGGIVADKGASMSEAETLALAKNELSELFPELGWQHRLWASCFVDRAEPYASEGFFKSAPELYARGRVAVAWPTKLTFAPALGHEVETWISNLGLEKTHDSTTTLPTPIKLGNYPWEHTKWQQID